MKKKIFFIIILISLICLMVFLAFNFSTGDVQNMENYVEIQPEEEVAQDQDFDTKIKVFYVDDTSGLIVSESRNVDARKLIDNPYMFVCKELLKAPETENLKMVIPEGTIFNSTNLKGNCLNIDCNEQFLNAQNTDALYCIVNSMCEFTEVESVKFTINGEEKQQFKDAFVKKQ